MSIIGGTAFQFLADQCLNGLHDVENDALFFAMYTTDANIDVETVDLQAAIGNGRHHSQLTPAAFWATQLVFEAPAHQL